MIEILILLCVNSF
uniref:Uncharacterized protein n=1 Tax=Anguilla anguilla TaxID=7936 RepID=A0A0E9VCW0_ANGAN